ncbi:MAG: DUF177 domain-containing protein [Chloroflexi bacterium]|nr:DUF177 domain-containing protein [Chloroflexota bacterium]
MTNPRKPFRINVGFIVSEEVGYLHKVPFDFEQAKLEDDLVLTHFSGVASISRTPQGLLLQGDFKGGITLECVRCLTDFQHDLHWDFTELYAFSKKSVTDSGLLLPDDAQIDLAPLLRDYALLEVPINPICKPECKGLCLECGENLNLVDCGHRPQHNNSPFSSLKDLL